VKPTDYPDAPTKSPLTKFPRELRKSGVHYVVKPVQMAQGESLYAAKALAGRRNIFFGGMSHHLQVPSRFDPSGKYPKESGNRRKVFRATCSQTPHQVSQGVKGRSPFLMYVAYHAPHDPRGHPKQDADIMYKRRGSQSKNFLEEHHLGTKERWKLRDEMLAPHPRTQETGASILRRLRHDSHVDSQMASVMEALERPGTPKDTTVIFAADNGLRGWQNGSARQAEDLRP